MADSSPTNRPHQVEAAQLAVLLDALDGVPTSNAERRALAWVAEWEIEIVEHIAAVIRRARAADPAHRVTRPPTWEEQVTDAVCAVFPAEVAPAILSDDAIGALRYRMQLRCQDTGESPAVVLGSLPADDRAFCSRAEHPAAFIANRITGDAR